MKNLSLRIGLIGLTVAGAVAGQAYDFVNLRAPNTGTQVNIIQQGVFSAGVAGSFTSTNVSGGGTSSSTDLSLNGGYFVTNEIQITGDLRYMSTTGGGTTSTTIFVVGGRYYFGAAQDKQVLPFAGVFGGFGQSRGGGTTNLSVFGGEVGLQYFLAPTVSFTPVLSYRSLHASGVTANQFGLDVGITVWFK